MEDYKNRIKTPYDKEKDKEQIMDGYAVTDNRTLYVRCEGATSQQIKTCMEEALATYREKTGEPLPCDVVINLVENRERKSYGIAFVFVTNPQVYHMLVGLNPDGSEKTPADPESLILKFSPEHGDSYPPLLEFSPAIVYPVEEGYLHNVLKCKKIPGWVSVDDILSIAEVYAIKDPFVEARPEDYVRDSYPMVEITRNGEVFVTYDPETNDALFALHMMKKIFIKKNNISCVLTFFPAPEEERYSEPPRHYKPKRKQHPNKPPKEENRIHNRFSALS